MIFNKQPWDILSFSSDFFDEGTCRCGRSRSSSYEGGWFGATQAFETIGLIAGFVGLILTILYIFVTQTAGNRVLFIIDLLAVGIAAGSTLLGVIIYGANASALSWSFALAVIAGLVYGVAGALMVIHLLKPNLVQG